MSYCNNEYVIHYNTQEEGQDLCFFSGPQPYELGIYGGHREFALSHKMVDIFQKFHYAVLLQKWTRHITIRKKKSHYKIKDNCAFFDTRLIFGQQPYEIRIYGGHRKFALTHKMMAIFQKCEVSCKCPITIMKTSRHNTEEEVSALQY